MNKIIEAEDLVSPLRDRLGRPITLAEVCSPVGPGWHPLISELVEDLILLGWNGSIDQVKEKFGGLRCSIYCTTVAMEQLIEDAEHKSLRTCEECGAKGRTDGWGGYWLRTLCSKHGAEREAKNVRA